MDIFIYIIVASHYLLRNGNYFLSFLFKTKRMSTLRGSLKGLFNSYRTQRRGISIFCKILCYTTLIIIIPSIMRIFEQVPQGQSHLKALDLNSFDIELEVDEDGYEQISPQRSPYSSQGS